MSDSSVPRHDRSRRRLFRAVGVSVRAGVGLPALQTADSEATDLGTVVTETGVKNPVAEELNRCCCQNVVAPPDRIRPGKGQMWSGSRGEMCIIEPVVRSASVRALDEPTVLFALHSSDLHRLYKINPEQFSILILNIARDICRRLRQVDELYTAKAN